MKFTKRFNEIIKLSGAKQTELAKYCNVSRQNITNFKRGKSYPSIDTLYNICRFFDISADYLLGLSDF